MLRRTSDTNVDAPAKAPAGVRRRIVRIFAITIAGALLLLVAATIISGPTPPEPKEVAAPLPAGRQGAGSMPSPDADGYGGDWVLVARDSSGGAVYLDHGNIRVAGVHAVADLGIITQHGRKVERLNITCSDNSATEVQSFGDDVGTTANITGDAPDGINRHSVFDYICGRAKLPAGKASVLPTHS